MNFLILFLLAAQLSAADPAINSFYPYSCEYQKIGDAEWVHLPYSGVKNPIKLGHDLLYVATAMTIGPTGTEFAAFCSGIFQNNGRDFLFVQSASGTGLKFTHAPTCMLSGGDIKSNSQIAELLEGEKYIIERRVFALSDRSGEMFYIAGVAQTAGAQKAKCDQIFESETGVTPK